MALFVEIKVKVIKFSTSQQVSVQHHYFLPLVEDLFKPFIPRDQIQNDNLATHIVLLKPVVVLEHAGARN